MEVARAAVPIHNLRGEPWLEGNRQRSPLCAVSRNRRVQMSRREGDLLPPAAFDKHVAVMPVLTSRTNTYGMFPGRYFVPAGLPNVGLPVPSVTATNPHGSRARRDRAVLHNDYW